MGERRRQYDKAFKVSAVKLLESSDRSLDLVARELGISGSMLRRWRDQIHEHGAEYFTESGCQDRREILRLRRENKDLKRQVEILKKTIGSPVRGRQRGIKP